MAGTPPLREPIINLKTGRLMPVWERYFTLTLQPAINESGSTGGSAVDFSAIIFGDGSIDGKIDTLEKLLFALLPVANQDLRQRVENLEKAQFTDTTASLIRRIEKLEDEGYTRQTILSLPQDLHTDADVEFNGVTIDESFILDPSGTIDITAGGGISPTKPIVHIQGDGGPVVVTANPQISAGENGEILKLMGVSDTNTVEINDGNGLDLHGKAVIGLGDVMELHYMTSLSKWVEDYRNFPESEKPWPFDSPAGSFGTFYFGGHYEHAPTDNDFNPAINFGTANASRAAHIYFVQAAGGAGGTDTVIRVSGTSIADSGTRTAGDTEDITIDDAGAAGTFYETENKWIGQVSITKISGPDLLCNYGWCKYWDNNNNDFRVTGLEVTWLGGANDAGANIGIRHHKATGWTYNNGAAATPPAYIADMNTDHNTEINIVNNENGAWKRDNLNTVIDGGDSEGTIFEVITTANKTFELGTIMLRVRPN